MSKHRNGEEAAPNSAPLCDTELSEQDRNLLKDALDDASRVPETLHRDIMDAVQREKAPKEEAQSFAHLSLSPYYMFR